MEDEMPPDRDQLIDRPLPSSPESERAILGAIILDNDLIGQAIELLKADDFYVGSHKRIFLAMIDLFEQGSEINPILIAEELKREGALEFSGGVMFITNLTYGLPHFPSIASFAKIVIDRSKLRKVIKLCSKITSEALEGAEHAIDVVEHLGKGTFNIAMEVTQKGFVSAGTLAHANLQKAHDIQTLGTAVTGVATDLTDFDALTLGLQRTDSIIVAGRPSMGKTALALHMATNAAVNHGLKVAFFSLEMSEEQIGNRILCSMARVDSQLFRSGFLNAEAWDRLHEAEDKLSNAKFFIDDTPAIGTLQMRTKLRKLSMQFGKLDLVVVDYIQLMTNSSQSKYTESRQQEVTQISRELKALAKDVDVPLMILSQLSRAPENRSDHRPVLSDLRESGSIEQDADLVAFIYREDKYKSHTDGSEKTNTAEIILAKQRSGPTGMALVRFEDSTGRFDNLAHQHESGSWS